MQRGGGGDRRTGHAAIIDYCRGHQISDGSVFISDLYLYKVIYIRTDTRKGHRNQTAAVHSAKRP